MSESGHKTMADDFYERLKKNFRPKFIENVDNPTHLVDYLQCLETVDEEIIKAQQTEKGAICAASILYDYLTRRPNWKEDVQRAFRDQNVGLGFLADELEKIECTVPVRWDICGFKDKNGRACFNGHCSDEPSNSNEGGNSNVEMEMLKDEQEQTPTTKYPDEPGPNETGNDSHEAIASPAEGIAKEIAKLPSVPTNTTATHTWETISLEREAIRNKMMEKVLSFIQIPQDVPVALDYMKQINIHLGRIESGSVLFNIFIGSLEALQSFEELWRYGGLKKLLDKEILDEDMIKALKAEAEKACHPVEEIKSQLTVFETDIERCRSSLIQNRVDVRPVNFTDTLALMNDKSNRETKIAKEVVKYVTDRLPQELQDVIEDPFVSDRIGQFYKSERLIKKFTEEKSGSITEETRSSVSQIFIEWLNEEISAYLKGLDDETTLHLLRLATYLVDKVISGDTTAIPKQALSETFATQQIKVRFSTGKHDSTFWFEKLELPNELEVDNEKLQTACKELSEKGRICQSKSQLNFKSALLRDVFVIKVVVCSIYKDKFKITAASFEYMQTLIGMYKTKILKYISHQAETEITECAFKTPELREIGISGTGGHVKGIESSFYNQDIIYSLIDDVKVTKEVSDAGIKMARNWKIDLKAKHMAVDMSEAMDDKAFSMKAALQWLNVQTRALSCYSKSLTVNNHKVTTQDLENIGLYLNATPNGLHLSLLNCQLEGDLLANVIETGHFRNIKQLNMSGNSKLGKSSRPLGLMYIRSLEKLDLQNCDLGDDGMKVLAMDLIYTDKLRQLNVANNRISPKGLMELSKATNKRMTALRIQKNYIGKEGSWILASLLESLILLEVFNISNCGIGDTGSTVIANALVSRSLRKLSMRKNGFSPKGSRDFFRNFKRPPYLEHLDFSENTLFTEERRYHASAQDWPPCGTDEPFVEFLKHPSPMSHLSLWNTYAGEIRIFQGLHKYKCFEEMTYICLQENNISDNFAKDLSECIKSPECCHLQHFNVRENQIGTIGAIEIAKALSTQRYLKEILLDRNEIGNEGAEQIVMKCGNLPAIKKIDLSCNNTSRRKIEDIVTGFEGEVIVSKMEDTKWNSTQVGALGVIRKQELLEESIFTIIRDGEKFVVTT